MNRAGQFIRRYWPQLLLLCLLAAGMLAVGLALPWNTIAVGSEYRTRFSNEPEANMDEANYDEAIDRFVITMTDGTIQVFARGEENVTYTKARRLRECAPGNRIETQSMLHNDYLVAIGREYGWVNSVHSETGFLAVYDLANDSLVLSLPLACKGLGYASLAVWSGDTLCYAYGTAIYQLQLTRPWRQAMPQLLVQESGRIDELCPVAGTERFVYQVTQETVSHRVTIGEYRGAAGMDVLLTQVPDSGDWRIPDWRIITATHTHLVMRNAGADMSERADLVFHRADATFDTIADRVHMAEPCGNRFIASMGILGDAYVSGFPALGLVDARTGKVAGYQLQSDRPDRMFPLRDGRVLLLYRDSEQHGEGCASKHTMLLRSNIVRARSESYLAATRLSMKLLYPLHLLLRAVCLTVLTFVEPDAVIF